MRYLNLFSLFHCIGQHMICIWKRNSCSNSLMTSTILSLPAAFRLNLKISITLFHATNLHYFHNVESVTR